MTTDTRHRAAPPESDLHLILTVLSGGEEKSSPGIQIVASSVVSDDMRVSVDMAVRRGQGLHLHLERGQRVAGPGWVLSAPDLELHHVDGGLVIYQVLQGRPLQPPFLALAGLALEAELTSRPD